MTQPHPHPSPLPPEPPYGTAQPATPGLQPLPPPRPMASSAQVLLYVLVAHRDVHPLLRRLLRLTILARPEDAPREGSKADSRICESSAGSRASRRHRSLRTETLGGNRHLPKPRQSLRR